VFSLSLHYHDVQKVDQYGNWFHYRASVNPDPNDGESKDGRVAYDVFFEVAPNQSVRTTQPRLLLEGLDVGIYRSARVKQTLPCKRDDPGGGQ
jgi:hypothetical protein